MDAGPGPGEGEADSLARQRATRRDRMLGPTPRLDRVMTAATRLLHCHLVFVVCATLVSGVSARAGRLLLSLLSPLADLVFFLYPGYLVAGRFDGPFGQDFYRAWVGEIFFVACALGLLHAVVYCGRYGRMPARMYRFMLEQNGMKDSWSAALALALTCALFGAMAGVALYVWLGLAPPEQDAGIALHQLALWAVLMPGATMGLAICLAAMSSAICGLFGKLACGLLRHV